MGEKLSFESRYCLTTAMTKEYAKYVFCKTTRILGGIIMLVSAAALIISMVWAGYGLSDITLFILCFTAGLLIYNYYFLISMVVEKQAKRNGMKEPPECAVYFGSSVRMKEGKEEIAVKYPQIRRILCVNPVLNINLHLTSSGIRDFCPYFFAVLQPPQA